jgi:hypothetical protein
MLHPFVSQDEQGDVGVTEERSLSVSGLDR